MEKRGDFAVISGGIKLCATELEAEKGRGLETNHSEVRKCEPVASVHALEKQSMSPW